MRTRRWLGAGVLVGAMGLIVGLAGPAQSQKVAPAQPQPAQPQVAAPARPQRPQGPQTLKDRVRDLSKLSEKDTETFLKAIGPAIRDHLRTGQQVEVAGLGTFRVVAIPPHRDLAGGRAVTLPGSNYVEFLPSGGLVDAANAPGVLPNETVPPFLYVPIPGRDPGMKSGNNRALGVRTP